MIGLLHWYFFISYGKPTFKAFDWVYIHQWLDVIRQALLTLKIPYHASYYLNEFPTGPFVFGDRFFAIPFLTISPQVFLLSLLKIPSFMAIQLLLVYTVGFLGIYRWIKHLNLSVAAAIFLTLLFNFNGFLIGRMGVGHLQNGAYFFVPWFLWFIFKFINEEFFQLERIRTVFQYAFFLLLVLLQGSLQVFYQMVIVGFVGVMFYRKRVWWYSISVIMAMIFSSYLIWPNALEGLYPKAISRVIVCGYGCPLAAAFVPLIKHNPISAVFVNSVYHIWQGLTYIYTAAIDESWEFSMHISIVGVFLILGSCLMIFRKYRRPIPALLRRYPFLLSAMIIVILSIYTVSHHIFKVIQKIVAVPAIDRWPSRLLLYPLSLVFLIAAAGFDDLFAKIKWKRTRVLIMTLILLIFFGLLMWNSYGWSVAQTEKNYISYPGQFTQEFYTVIYDRDNDIPYKRVVKIAYLVSLVTALSAGLLYYRYIRKKNSPSLERGKT